MKRTLAIAALLIANAAPAQAGEISKVQSKPGVSQNEWTNSSEYQNFRCLNGLLKGDGVDMNFTTDSRDDFYYAYCYEPVFIPGPNISTIQETIQPGSSVHVGTEPLVQSITNLSTNESVTSTVIWDSATAILETATVTSILSGFDWSAFLEMFKSWFTLWFSAWGRL